MDGGDIAELFSNTNENDFNFKRRYQNKINVTDATLRKLHSQL